MRDQTNYIQRVFLKETGDDDSRANNNRNSDCHFVVWVRPGPY